MTDKCQNGIIKYWGQGYCKRRLVNFRFFGFFDLLDRIFHLEPHREPHWAYYTYENESEKSYWEDEHIDEKNKAYWRHYTFMSIPCHHCGAYSPLRCSNMFSSGDSNLSCKKEVIVNYRPDNKLPDNLAYYREAGWSYIYFKETLSDSLTGQETFRLKYDPTIDTPPPTPAP